MNADLESIKNFLRQDIIKNINLLYFMENYPVSYILRYENSVLMRGESDHCWTYISSGRMDEFSEIIKKLKTEDKYFAVIEDWMQPELLKDRKCVWNFSTVRRYLPDDIIIPKRFNYELTWLEPEDALYIFEHSDYKEYSSLEYITERIKNGTSAGVRISGKLIAWAMTHDDTAIGFLRVDEEYRNKGYAEAVLVEMISKTRDIGKIPYVHVEKSNVKSMRLTTKLGFVDDRNVSWIAVQ